LQQKDLDPYRNSGRLVVTCAIVYSPLRRYSSRQKRVFKIPIHGTGATIATRGQMIRTVLMLLDSLLLSSWFS
jgi:hypothetical protein